MASTPETPLSAIREKPNRRSHSETLIRELINTSYPHGLLANLGIAFAEQAGCNQEEQNGLAQVFKEGEAKYSIFDFVRCVEIKRLSGLVTIIIKALKTDLEMSKIDDDRRNHEFMATGKVELQPANAPLARPDVLARQILYAFYQTQVKYRQREPGFEKSTWLCRLKTEHDAVDELYTHEQAVALLAASLSRPKFHFILTPDTLLVCDQHRRLWGLNTAPKRRR